MSLDVIEKKILLKAPLARVWRAVSDATEFGRWFGMRFEGPFQPNTRMTGTLVPTEVDPEIAKSQQSYAGQAFEFTIVDLEPQRRLSFRWHPFAVDPKVDYSQEPTTLVVFSLEEVSGGVELTITESGFEHLPPERRKPAFAANDEGWAVMAKIIGLYLSR